MVVSKLHALQVFVGNQEQKFQEESLYMLALPSKIAQ